jgi:hypothetical protein
LLSGLNSVVLPHEADYGRHVYHIYAIRVCMRYSLMMALAKKGIECGVHYPIPIHRQKAYHFLKLARGRFPVAERCAEDSLSLPMFPELTKKQIEYVVDEIGRWSGVEIKSNILKTEKLCGINMLQYGQTVIHPVALGFTLMAGVLMVLLPRRYVIVPFVVAAIFIPIQQRLVIASLDFFMLCTQS